MCVCVHVLVSVSVFMLCMVSVEGVIGVSVRVWVLVGVICLALIS